MPDRQRIIAFALLAFLGLGIAAACWAAAYDLTLAHYDARGHLIVARRVIDSLTPGWRQFGAVWLPLPHLVNALPVQHDPWFRSGASAVAVNILLMAAGLTALARLVARVHGSWLAGLAGAALVAANPDVLFLTGTPMTEPMLLALLWLGLDALTRPQPDGTPSAAAGPWLALATLTRYEAWPVAAVMVTLAAASAPAGRRRQCFLRLARWPVAAVAGFLVLGRLAVGRWFTGDGFFTPDNPARHSSLAVLAQVWHGYVEVAGPLLVTAALVGLALLTRAAWRAGRTAPLVPIGYAAAAALPLVAFYDGHPFRIRYMLPLVAASGAFAGAAIAAIPRRRWRLVVALLLVGGSLATRPPFSLTSPMVRESQRERIAQTGRSAITRTLAAAWDRTPILASMDSLGHYMQETAAIGLPLRAYLHEGNGDLWTAAIASPAAHVGWILIEWDAEGGDTLAARARRDPAWLHGFTEVTEGGGAALYRKR